MLGSVVSWAVQLMGTGLDSQKSRDDIKYIIEASSSYNPTKVQLFKQGHAK